MDDINAGLLKPIDSLIKSLANRVTFWPPVEEHEIETSKLDFVRLLVEKYIEVLGLKKVANIIRSSTTGLETLEALEEEIALRESKELENLLGTKCVDMNNIPELSPRGVLGSYK